jgi:hypothetical protein
MQEKYKELKEAGRASLRKSEKGQIGIEITKFDEAGQPTTEIIEVQPNELEKQITDESARLASLQLLLNDIKEL